MRIIELLTEAELNSSTTLTSWPGYLQNLINAKNISLKGGTSGLQLSPESQATIQQLISDFSQAEDKTPFQYSIPKTVISFTDGTSSVIGKIFKSQEIKTGVASGSSEEGKEKFDTRASGLVAEALLGIAMYAKLINRGGDLTGKITPVDVWDLVGQVKPEGNDRLTSETYDINHKVSDHIYLSITIPKDIQYLLTNQKYRNRFEDSVQAWCNYVNSDLAQKYADNLYTNNRPDNVGIMLAGKEGGKIDVAINVLDKNGVATRRMEQVKLSVKLSNSIIGQAPRGKTPNEVYENLASLFSPLGVDISGKRQEIIDSAENDGGSTQYVDAMTIGYLAAADQLKSLSSEGIEDDTLAMKVSRLCELHATGGDTDIQVIEKGEGSDYKILNYRGIVDAFEKNNIDLDVIYTTGTSEKLSGKTVPKIKIFNKNGSKRNNLLVEIRFRPRGNYANHIIEPGKLLKKIAAYNRFQK